MDRTYLLPSQEARLAREAERRSKSHFTLGEAHYSACINAIAISGVGGGGKQSLVLARVRCRVSRRAARAGLDRPERRGGARRARTISPDSTDDKRRRFSNTPRATHNKLTAARAVWPAAGAAKPLDAAAVARGHGPEPPDDKCCRFSNTPWATHKKLAAARAVWPAAEAAKPLDAAAAVTRGRADLPVHPCRLRAGLQAVCAPSAGFQS